MFYSMVFFPSAKGKKGQGQRQKKIHHQKPGGFLYPNFVTFHVAMDITEAAK